MQLFLYVVNVGCWALLALAEPDAPAAAWVKSVTSASGTHSLVHRLFAAGGRGAASATASAATQPVLALSGPTKTACVQPPGSKL